MKKQIVFLAVLFFCVAALLAEEQISSISFNPSRLGLFEQLRLTEGLTSQGDVSVTNEMNIRQDTGLTTKDGLDVRETIDARQGRVNIPNTNLNVTGNNMAVNGGFALFKGASTLGGLPANTWVYAPTIKSGTLTITGSNDGALLFDPDSYAQGLVLGGNDIPVPNHSECTGGLAWVTRKAADGKTYDVLAVTGCKDTTSACEEGKIQWVSSSGASFNDETNPYLINCHVHKYQEKCTNGVWKRTGKVQTDASSCECNLTANDCPTPEQFNRSSCKCACSCPSVQEGDSCYKPADAGYEGENMYYGTYYAGTLSAVSCNPYTCQLSGTCSFDVYTWEINTHIGCGMYPCEGDTIKPAGTCNKEGATGYATIATSPIGCCQQYICTKSSAGGGSGRFCVGSNICSYKN